MSHTGLAVWLSCFVLAHVCFAMQELTNINCVGLGMGYDIFLGNPHNQSCDPGFRRAIFQLTDDQNRFSTDDHVQAQQIESCSYNTRSNVVKGSTSYQNSLSVDASLSIDATVAGDPSKNRTGWGEKFSASTGYMEVKSDSNNLEKTYVISVAKCIQSEAALTPGAQVTSDFKFHVETLPIDANSFEDYISFIKAYGTHYVSTVVMGSKVVVQSEFKIENWAMLTQSNLNVTLAAQLSFIADYSASDEVNILKEIREQFERLRTSKNVFYIGSKPSGDGKLETWTESTGKSPYPVAYTLSEITSLFDVSYFGNLAAEELEAKKSILKNVYTSYCGLLPAVHKMLVKSIPGCSYPEADRPTVQMDTISSTVIDGIVSCNQGLSLLSCGYGSPREGSEKQFDLDRYAVPESSTACRCKDVNTIKCHAQCTNAIQGFEIASITGIGKFTTPCPGDKKVLGCHIRAPVYKEEFFRQAYPSDDGSKCHCFAEHDAKCIATCGSNIIAYEVVKSYGSQKKIIVTCPAYSYLLGCGIDPVQEQGHFEVFREVYASSVDSCTCYDFYGANCYATCGRFK